MQFRNIYISSAKHISIKDNQLVIDQSEFTIAIEDINSIIIENMYTSMSAYTISKLTEMGVVVYTCNESHIPCTVMLPIVKHSRHFKMLKNQISSSKPLQKQMWQSVIVRKIYNQGRCLECLDINGYERLYEMSKEVKSGDSTHIEAKAASFYFGKLFNGESTRKDENTVNAMLNYGYSIIRGMIARSIVTYGFEPSIGIWHKSELNSFNLADDFIEPFRPLVDLYVFGLMDIFKEELEPMDKRLLIQMLDYDLEIDGENRVIKNCVDLLVSSYSTSLQKNVNLLCLPELNGLRKHRYE